MKPHPTPGRASEQLTKEDCLEMFRQLYLARYFDVRLIKEKKRGRLRGTLYSSHNQEAIIVGSIFGLRPTDWISPVHRDMPMFFMKDMRAGWRNPDRMGMSIEEVCAQVWCKSGSPGRARDNWSHIGSLEKRIIHSTSMLAGTIPVAAGVVLADRLNGGDAVVLTFNGEGSTAQGIFHEAINYAAIHKLPVITVVENNQWAYGTPVQLEVPTEDVADRAKGYGIPGYIADGQDVFDVYDKVMEAVEYARSGKGPSIVECKTFRAYGHGDHDDDRAAKYRDPHEVEEGRLRDPLAICRRRLIEKSYLTADDAIRFMAEGKSSSEATTEDFPPEVVAYLDEGIRFALASPEPPAEEGGMWVFKESE
ncbi:MAG: thiamine pyrophosphate-dependent dehydrogenase E1 component subunit alpha [Fimbriimonas ginsengisoli]|uniref:Thiamine pyrophosphate-dependent dehydrogenase E1 component subunit alpha n=1 Tax=Fimbriimonas ginsengisoli TaxID=1005039 RepID=A0A931LUS8_FIMGI|nr:thiamine pyrophosphate-dependent dehydrogenase E1 component subunit alpha [Fimbriimonas ginsengisoli]